MHIHRSYLIFSRYFWPLTNTCTYIYLSVCVFIHLHAYTGRYFYICICVYVCMHLPKTMGGGVPKTQFLISLAFHFLIQLLRCSWPCLSVFWSLPIEAATLSSSWVLIPALLYSSSLSKVLLSKLYVSAIASALVLCHCFSSLLFLCPLNCSFPWFLWKVYMVVLLLHLLCLPCSSHCLSTAGSQIHIHFPHSVPLARTKLSDSRQCLFRL